jgi:hypothetical protein
LYVGYITTSPDFGPQLFSYRFNGGEIAYTKNLNRRWAVVASGAGLFGTVYSVKEFSGTAGMKFNVLTGAFRPYATLQVGYASLTATGMYNGDHHPPVPQGQSVTDDGLTYRGGIGADVQLSPRIYWRAIQWDIQPQPWARHTPFYMNFSTGWGYRF